MENRGAYFLAGLGGIMLFAAQTKREDAVSNLATWVKPVKDVPHVESIATAIAFALIALGLIMIFRPREPKSARPSPQGAGVNLSDNAKLTMTGGRLAGNKGGGLIQTGDSEARLKDTDIEDNG